MTEKDMSSEEARFWDDVDQVVLSALHEMQIVLDKHTGLSRIRVSIGINFLANVIREALEADNEHETMEMRTEFIADMSASIKTMLEATEIATRPASLNTH